MALVRELIVDQFGAMVGLHSKRLQVTLKQEVIAEAPLIGLEGVVISGRGISLSANAIAACCEQGIPIHFLSSRGEPYAALYSAGLTGTVQTRRAQLLAYGDGRGLALARAFAEGKIRNQANLLKYMAKYRKETDAALYRELRLVAGEVLSYVIDLDRLKGECIDEVREQILSVEGRAAQKYWAAVKLVVPKELGWPGREGRGARDPLNSALNYGYGILYGQVERALVLAGLDPYAGFIHVDRPGKPSLVLDLIEEFRQPVVDRTVLGLVNKGVALEQDEEGRLTEGTRRMLAERVLGRLEESTERYEGKRHALRVILQMQARHLATYIRGDRERYEPFVAGW